MIETPPASLTTTHTCIVSILAHIFQKHYQPKNSILKWGINDTEADNATKVCKYHSPLQGPSKTLPWILGTALISQGQYKLIQTGTDTEKDF